jgi:1-deoxy-D-xylulose-5-phosphate reductoisomerase
MRVPIQYALAYPERIYLDTPAVDFAKLAKLTFGEPDEETFLCLKACKRAFDMGGLYPCAVNGANEQAVALFLEDKISFLQIGELVWCVLDAIGTLPASYGLDEILETDRKAREYVRAKTGC